MRSLRSFAAVMLVCIAGVACSNPVPTQGPPPPKQGSDLLIGVPINASGNLVQEGGLTKQGYELWLDWANKDGGILVQGERHRVKLLYEDDASRADVAAQMTEKLITEEKAQFLLGPYGSVDTGAAAAVAQKHHVPMVASNGAARQIYMQGFNYVFGILAPPDLYPQAVIDLENAVNPKIQTYALLTADDPFSLETTKATKDYAAAKGQQLVYFQQYPNGSTNLYPYVQAAKAKNPDLVVNIGHLLEAVAVAKAARDLRLDAKMFVYASGPDTPEFTQALGPAADYVVTGSPWTAQAKYKASYYLSSAEYVAAYRKKYNTQGEPVFPTADATAAGITLQAAIEHAQSLDPDRVRDALATLSIDTFYGQIKFDEHGQVTSKRLLVEQIQNGRPTTIWPPELAAAAPAYPTPTWSVRLGLPPAAPAAKLPGTGEPPSKH
jgi:branched-chain amino acid transport system substrate-binding protein